MNADESPPIEGLAKLRVLFDRGDVALLTGAGISTGSGIPDYRGPGTQARARNPVQYREFVKSAHARRRYWARSVVGYPRIRDARPNVVHEAVTALASRGVVTGLITQNVDGLHARAGHGEHVELHGALREVVCLECRALDSRDRFQEVLLARNPWLAGAGAAFAPDGDADLEDPRLASLDVMACAACGGDLKPHVVFFGENVPRPRVERAAAIVENARALVVLGSSLAVFSGLRFVRQAHSRGIPVAIVTYGVTRGDGFADVKLEVDVGDVMRFLRGVTL